MYLHATIVTVALLGGCSIASGLDDFEVRPPESAQTATCGNGNIDTGEHCDDGNTITGDGCSAHCESEDSCPGAAVSLSAGQTLSIEGDTAGRQDDYRSEGCGKLGDGAADSVFAITPTADGQLRISASANYPVHLYLRTNCTDKRSEQTCGDGSASAALTQDVVANTPYYLIVDGNGEAGPFSLSLSL